MAPDDRLDALEERVAALEATLEATPAELSSTGKLYHHLRALSGARVVEQDGHHYRVPATGTVPVLVTVLAAGDLGGLL